MVEDAGFEATCEACGGGQWLTPEDELERVHANGSFTCDDCLDAGALVNADGSVRRGCIVTAQYPGQGRLRTLHRNGRVVDALREIAFALPAGAVIRSISTPRSIAHDLKGVPRRHPNGEVDAYRVERHLLGRIRRLDLLPPEARRLGDHYPSGRR